MSGNGTIVDTDNAHSQFPPDRRRRAPLILGTALVAAGVVWFLAGRPLAWTIIFNDFGGFDGSEARAAADALTSTHWSLLLPLAVLVGLGLALITMTLAASSGAEDRRSWATNRGRAGITATIVGFMMVIVAAAVQIQIGWWAYDRHIWVPVFLVGFALLAGGVVLILVGRAASPVTRARRVANADLMAAGAAEAELHRRAEDIKTWEAAYALAHNGEKPPPGFVPVGAFRTETPRSKTNGLAIAALIVSIAVNGVVGLVLGYVARRQIDARHEGGRGLAVAAIIIGWIGVGVVAVATIVLLVLSSLGVV